MGVEVPAVKGVLFILTLLAGFNAAGQDLRVSVWKHPETNFGRYDSFNWSTRLDEILDEDAFFLDDLVLKADVKFAIKSEFVERGYAMNRFTPDLVVDARVLDRPAVIQRVNDNGPRDWAKRESVPYHRRTGTRVEAGTLIISIMDRTTNEVVWEARVAGLMNQNEFVKDETIIRKAIDLLFEEYDIPEGTYTRR